MLLLRLIRFIYGYVYFEGSGKHPEMFMNTVRRRGFNIWNISSMKGNIKGYITKNQYKLLRPVAYKSEVKISIKKKVGLPFLIHKYKYRWGMLAGSILFIMIIYVLSLYVWVVEVKGNNQIQKDTIIETAAEFGIRTGSLKSKLDLDILEQKLMEKIPDISWIAINMRGSIIVIELKERDNPPDVLKEDQKSNLISTTAGQITRLEVYSGKSEVSIGDVVEKGQMLVNGIVQDDLGGTTIKRSQGKVFAKTRRFLEESYPLVNEVQINSGETVTRKELQFFGIKLPINLAQVPAQECKLEIVKSKAYVLNSMLPVELYEEKFTPIVKQSQVLSAKEAEEKAQEKIKLREETELQNITVLDKTVSTQELDGKIKLSVSYLCEENIATEVPLQIS